MNLHLGGMSGQRGRIYFGSTKNPLAGYPGSGGATTEDEFTKNLEMAERFRILSIYGENWSKTAYNYLKDEKEAANLINSEERTQAQIQAINDFERVTDILSNDSFTNSMKNYIKNTIKFDSDEEEEHLDGDNTTASSITTTTLNDGSLEVSENVDDASHGCQVIYGGAQFYDYLWNTTNKAENSGQKRWYYTIIDLTTPYNDIPTEEIDLNE